MTIIFASTITTRWTRFRFVSFAAGCALVLIALVIKVHAWEAHQDYIRDVAIHPSQPFILSSSDDMLIKLWDWDKNWQCTRTFEGHSHYVMKICFNPKVSKGRAALSTLTHPQIRYALAFLSPSLARPDEHPTQDPNVFASASLDRSIKVCSLCWCDCVF
jgi:WD40 repeat protein